MMLIKETVDNDNLEIIGFFTNNITFYHSIFSNKASTPSNHLVKSNKLLVFFKSVVQDSNFDLFNLFQLADFLTENFIDRNSIEL